MTSSGSYLVNFWANLFSITFLSHFRNLPIASEDSEAETVSSVRVRCIRLRVEDVKQINGSVIGFVDANLEDCNDILASGY